MDRRTDAEVIAESVDESRRFGEIFERHFTEIHRFVARRLGPGSAADVVGDVFATAFRRRADYDRARSDARPWLYGIATRLVAHHRHAERRRLLLLARSGEPTPTDGGLDGSDERLDAERLAPALLGALLRLSARDRDTLLLFAWADLSYEEISDALAIPIGTVRSRLSRARSLLRGTLAPRVTAEPKEAGNG